MKDRKMARVIMKAMGDSGVMEFSEVARRAGLDVRTVRDIGPGVRVDTLEAIAKALGGELVISIERKDSARREASPALATEAGEVWIVRASGEIFAIESSEAEAKDVLADLLSGTGYELDETDTDVERWIVEKGETRGLPTRQLIRTAERSVRS